MAFPYNPKDADRPCLPPGEYTASIKAVEEKKSKAGNAMLEVTLIVPGADGSETYISEYVVNPTGLFKLKKIAKALGRLDEFEAGVFDLAQYVGQPISVQLDIEKEAGYADKNKVKAYGDSATPAQPSGNHATKPAPAATGPIIHLVQEAIALASKVGLTKDDVKAICTRNNGTGWNGPRDSAALHALIASKSVVQDQSFDNDPMPPRPPSGGYDIPFNWLVAALLPMLGMMT